MKTISLRIFGTLLVLGVLWVSVPGVRADEAWDHADEIGQSQAQLWQQTVQDQEDLRNFSDEMSSLRQDAIDQARNQPAAPAAAPVAAPQVRFPAPAVPQPRPMPFDPVAFQQMVRQNQQRVQQQIMQVQQQVMQRQQEILQQHQLLTMGSLR
jgi:hypothetical protein